MATPREVLITKKSVTVLSTTREKPFKLGANKAGGLEMRNVSRCSARAPAHSLVNEDSDAQVTCCTH